MNIVILHCHMQRGGVTQVIENHVQAIVQLGGAHRVFLVSGPRVSGISKKTADRITPILLKDFDYDSAESANQPAELRAESMATELVDQFAAAGIDRDETVLHWHNHGLGKNTAAPGAIRRLAKLGWRLLLQIHDYAEDNRPENYLHLIRSIGATTQSDIDDYLYPSTDSIHYATLSHADRSVITGLGIDDARVHCLPNCVHFAEGVPDSATSRQKVAAAFGLADSAQWWLYPVRGIRRKNVGEFLLLSRFLPGDDIAGITLCPETPIEKRSYERWRSVGQALAPRAVFDCGHHREVSFMENLAASSGVLSTSVAEGFGMAMLEPWLADRGVVARDLPTVTRDFVASGVQLPGQYASIPIPADEQWLRESIVTSREAFHAAWKSLPEAFRPDFPSFDPSSGEIDFASLTPDRQTDVLQRMASDPGFETAVKERSFGIADRLKTPLAPETIRQNRVTIENRYSTEKQSRQLQSIYFSLLNARVDTLVKPPRSAGVALDLVSAARPFFPCRTEVI
ncbi:glycosyltransferase family protein [Novipirellula artificiosorum]|uniref:Glycosyl transferases group 1 n=1 Tax=Novipirellula artificiosorum TaxID=2528016 RepID=A0A5C6D979_9BACT|nr:glycosyltransferase family 4 protein [Novipirellula artificiosorum]TWU33410.1 hypothetical protein Poly41_51640 [Novipirellula artificiosorum]